MRYPRRIRFFAALVTLVSLLFTQVALAGYDCPQLAAKVGQALSTHDAVRGDCCVQHDKQSPNLCDAHGRAHAQSPDLSPQPLITPFVPAALFVALSQLDVPQPPSRAAPAAFLDAAGSSPPIPILHCRLLN